MSLDTMAQLRVRAEEAQAVPAARERAPVVVGGGGVGAGVDAEPEEAEVDEAVPGGEEPDRVGEGDEPGVEELSPGEQAVITLRDQLAAMVPVEAVTLYVAGVGPAAALGKDWVHWLLFAVVVLTTGIWVTTRYVKAGGVREVPVFEVVIGVLAFAAWSLTVPQGMSDVLGLGEEWGILIVIVASTVLFGVVQLAAEWGKAKNPIPQPA